jgi:hypothetical protein
MSNSMLLNNIVRLRLAVGLLGEKAANGWWPTSFLESSSKSFLDPVFGRTAKLAQFHGVTEAARRVHDARLAAGSFHLFRLPEEAEQDLHALVLAGSRSGDATGPMDEAAAMALLDELAAGSGADSPGPRLVGQSTSLTLDVAWQQVAATYRDAFRNGFQSFPYFSRA